MLARNPQLRAAISQGQTREEARNNVVDPLREVLAVRFGGAAERAGQDGQQPGRAL